MHSVTDEAIHPSPTNPEAKNPEEKVSRFEQRRRERIAKEAKQMYDNMCERFFKHLVPSTYSMMIKYCEALRHQYELEKNQIPQGGGTEITTEP